MIRPARSHLRRAASLGTLALLAVPLAANAADFRGQLTESIGSGIPAVDPPIALTAKIDNGTGGTPVPTGALRFTIDARHLAPSAWATLQAAPAGTRLGTVMSDLTGPNPVPLNVLAHGRDSAGPFVSAGIALPADRAAVIGSAALPAVVRTAAGGKQLTISTDLRSAVGHLTARKMAATLRTLTLTLPGRITIGAASRPLTLNPAKDTALVNSVAVQACGQPACTTLRPGASAGSALVHLPKQVFVSPPGTATYGYRYSIAGSARPGDQVMLRGLSNDGLVAVAGTASARANGSFTIRTTLRSTFSEDGDLAMPAAGRYAVASVEGNATVFGVATQDTHVSLAEPRFVLERKAADKLHFAIRVPGADRHVRVAIKLGSKTLAKGFVNDRGRFFKTIAKPSATGNLRVVASVPGADTAISLATPLSR